MSGCGSWYTGYMGIIAATLLGLIAGSFINAVVWRLHSGESIIYGRSMCPNCKHQLAAIDLIPVLSWVIQKGRCRYCKKPYGPHYLIVELATAALFGFSVLLLQSIGLVSLGVWLAILVCVIILALYDAQWYELPNNVMHPALVLAVIYFVLRFEGIESLIQLMVALAAGAVFYAAWWLSHGRLMGGADSKLVLLMGLVLAPKYLLLALALGFMLGGVGAAYLLYGKTKGLHDQMPFGPYLIGGLVIAQFWGAVLLDILGF
jgi:leader peptidase (prepilin peptidase)/N-methyltransferase